MGQGDAVSAATDVVVATQVVALDASHALAQTGFALWSLGHAITLEMAWAMVLCSGLEVPCRSEQETGGL